jgi:hypothetical protein
MGGAKRYPSPHQLGVAMVMGFARGQPILRAGAEWDLLEVRYVRVNDGVFVKSICRGRAGLLA